MSQHTSQFALVVAPTRKIFADTRENRWWILAVIGLLIVYILISAAIIRI